MSNFYLLSIKTINCEIINSPNKSNLQYGMKKAVYSKTVFKIPYLNIFKKIYLARKNEKIPYLRHKKKEIF